MNLFVISYGMLRENWETGEMMARQLTDMKDSKPAKFELMLQSSSNKKWYELAKANDHVWPYPKKILEDLAAIDPTSHIQMYPELNYLCVYGENPKVVEYLTENYSSIMS